MARARTRHSAGISPQLESFRPTTEIVVSPVRARVSPSPAMPDGCWISGFPARWMRFSIWAWDRPIWAWPVETNGNPRQSLDMPDGPRIGPGAVPTPHRGLPSSSHTCPRRGDLASLTGVVEQDVLAELAAALHRRAVVEPGQSTLLFLVPRASECASSETPASATKQLSVEGTSERLGWLTWPRDGSRGRGPLLVPASPRIVPPVVW